MPEREIEILLNDITRIFIYILTKSSNLDNFVIKLEYFHNGKWREIQRYDCEHGSVHKDILNREGKKIRTVFYRLVDKKSGLDMAIQDFKQNCEIYVWRYFNESK
jgi:hypothetical protein